MLRANIGGGRRRRKKLVEVVEGDGMKLGPSLITKVPRREAPVGDPIETGYRQMRSE